MSDFIERTIRQALTDCGLPANEWQADYQILKPLLDEIGIYPDEQADIIREYAEYVNIRTYVGGDALPDARREAAILMGLGA